MAILLPASCAMAQAGPVAPKAYPKAPIDTAVVDEYFSLKVADPYRPLENDTSAVTAAWVQDENALTHAYLAQIPFRDAVRRRLLDLYNYDKVSAPWRWHDGRYYQYRNEGMKNQSVLCRMDSLDQKPSIFLDPNTLSDDGTVALKEISMPETGKYMAYTISRNGSDWEEVYVMDAETGRLLDDHLEWVKFGSPSWLADEGFYYSAYDRPVPGKEFSNISENHRVYYHRLGTPQTDDLLVYEDAERPLLFNAVSVEGHGRLLALEGAGAGVGNSLMIRDLADPAQKETWTMVEPSQDYMVGIIDVRDSLLYIYTNYQAPRGRIVTAPISAPGRDNWVDFLPEDPQGGVISATQRTGKDGLIVTFERDASDHPVLYDMATGKPVRDIKLPSLGSTSFSCSDTSDDVFFAFASFLYPSAVYSYDKATGESKLYEAPQLTHFNPGDYVTEQVFYPSADGTMIPMFLTYKKGLERDGSNPAYIYGYGGFNISLTPMFNPSMLLWLENGGIYAQTNLRGGSEYGEQWHQGGTQLNKLNVFNDFIAAAQYLQQQGWTSPEKTAIVGGSNGGLLVGAVTNMRPDLYAVAIPQVGVMDMMRYHLFTVGWNWAPDYGTSADSPEMAAYLHGYSPLHNIHNDGTPYPAVMVTTADHDDRVVPAHSFKYAATLQASDTGEAPKLIRIDSKAGHGGGKPMAKVIDEKADIYSFIFQNLGVTPKAQ